MCNSASTQRYADCSGLCVEYSGGGMAQLVERRTEKPGAILTRVPFPGAARLLFFLLFWFSSSPRINFQYRFRLRSSYSPRIQSHASRSART